MKTHRLIALGAAAGMLAFSATAGLAEDPANPNQPLYQPGTDRPSGAVQADVDVERAEAERDQQLNDPDRGWMEQVRDWWNSDQGEVKTVTGTIVDLETFLINGEEAARQQSSTNASLYDNDPVALLTEGGELYLLLDRYERRVSFQHGDQIPAASDPGVSGTNKAGQGSEAFDAADQIAAGADMQQRQRIAAGQTVTLSGNAYDRAGIKGLLVHSYQIDSALGNASKHRAPADSSMGIDYSQPEDRATPRPADQTQPTE